MSGGGDFFLGVTGPEYYPRLPLTFEGEGNTMTIATQGKGKSTSILLANLVSQNCSVIVSDFKGELATKASLYRDAVLGIPSVVFDPFHIIDDKLLRHGPMQSDKPEDMLTRVAVRGRLDPLDFIRQSISPLSAAMRVAEAFVPENKEAKDPYWENGARNLFAAMMLFIAIDPLFEPFIAVPDSHKHFGSEHKLGRNMRTVALFLMTDRAERLALQVMRRSKIKLVSDQARAFYKAAKEDTGRSGVRDHLRHNIGETLGEEMILDSLTGTNVDFGTFVDRAQSAFLVLPGSMARTHVRWLRLLNMIALSQIENRGLRAHDSNRPIVRFHLDEFNTFRNFPTITEALGRMRGYGVRFSLYIQALGQLTATYGRDATNAITGTMECTQYFGGTKDEATAHHISDLCGMGTEIAASTSAQTGTGQHGGSYSQSMHGRLVKTKDEVMNLKMPKQLISITGLGATEVEIIPPWLPYFPRYVEFMRLMKVGLSKEIAAKACMRFPETLFEMPEPQPPPPPPPPPVKPRMGLFQMLDYLLALLMGHDTK